MAKKGQKYRKHSPEFKLSVIMDMRENHLGIMETERKYDVKHNVISKWERIFLEEGAEGLMKERRGRASKVDGIAKGRPPKLDKKIEEDLILRRIKPHTPLLVRAPVNSFEFQPCGRTPQVDYLLC